MTFTPKTVKLAPSDFVDDARQSGFAVENHLSKTHAWDDRFPTLRIGNYLCGNPNMGATNSANFARAGSFWNAMIEAMVKDPNAHDSLVKMRSLVSRFDLMAKGQGYPADFITMLEVSWYNREQFAKDPTLKPYFTLPTLKDLIARVESDNIVGWDCIGFIHQYLSAAKVVDAYLGYTALGYMSQFKPISSLDEIEPLALCSWSNDSHIVIIDHIVTREKDRVIVDLCQSSGSVKTTHMAHITRAGNYGIDAKGTKGAPLVTLGANLGHPVQFYISGDVPVRPNVLIGRLPGLRLQRGDASP